MTLFVLLGPTAVGKTELSLRLAELLQSPVINCDSRQIYHQIPICTAAPTQAERSRVEHYCVATHNLDQSYSAAQYEADVMQLLQPHAGGHRNFLLSGGSMMYADAVIRGIDDMPQADAAIRSRLRQQFETSGLEPLLQQLEALDPQYYASVDRRNPQRVIHGLEMCLTTGRPFSSFRTGQAKERPFRIVLIGLRRDREELYHRIDRRIDLMFEQGILAETEAVYREYQPEVDAQFAGVIRNPSPTQAQPIPNLLPQSLNTVGLKEMLLHYAGIYSLEQARERIAHNSKVYSKKQMTWFQRDPAIHWFNPDEWPEIRDFVDSTKEKS